MKIRTYAQNLWGRMDGHIELINIMISLREISIIILNFELTIWIQTPIEQPEFPFELEPNENNN